MPPILALFPGPMSDLLGVGPRNEATLAHPFCRQLRICLLYTTEPNT